MIQIQQQGPETESNNTELMVVPDSHGSDSELATLQLRARWELASVLNFFNVFGSIIGGDMKMSAEEIEMALINPNISLANLHITLLKGIPPVNKHLKDFDLWVSVLCMKLGAWWPWVAEDKFPLSSVKSYSKEDISRYKALDPVSRLLMLKALCELRADQVDTSSYINDALKNGTEIPCFCHDKLGGDGNETTYWYDGNTVTGYRLYKEVKKFKPIPKLRNKDGLTLPAFNFQWETLATNLVEFRKVLDDLSSRKVWGEMPVAKTIEVDVIPILEKLQKKKEMALLRNQKCEKLLNDFKNSFAVGITRSCRIRRPVSYTYDEYDQAIDEAIQVTKKRKTDKEQKYKGGLNERKDNIEEVSDGNLDPGEDSGKKHAKLQVGNGGHETDEEYIKKEDSVDNDDKKEATHSEKEDNNSGRANNDEKYLKKEDGVDNDDKREATHSEKEDNNSGRAKNDEEYIKKGVDNDDKREEATDSEKENNNSGRGKNDDPVKEARNNVTRIRSRQRLTVKNEQL